MVRILAEDMQSHFFLWDKSGTAAVIEWLDGEMKVYKVFVAYWFGSSC